MAVYLFSVKIFVFFSFVPPLIKSEGLGFFIIGVPLLHFIPPEVTLKYGFWLLYWPPFIPARRLG
jgi:hypothetical protein